MQISISCSQCSVDIMKSLVRIYRSFSRLLSLFGVLAILYLLVHESGHREQRSQRIESILIPQSIGPTCYPQHVTPQSNRSANSQRSNTDRTRSILSTDGLIRHCITGAVVGRIPDSVAVLRRPIADAVIVLAENETAREMERRARFARIFEKRAWGAGHDKSYTGLSASGDGSTLHHAQETIAIIQSVVSEMKRLNNVDRVSLLDLSCGDMQWMSRFLDTRDDIDYTGFDVVPQLIEHHRQTYKKRPWKFEVRDMVADNSPLDQYDIILARHTFMHLTTPDIIRVLKRLSSSASQNKDKSPQRRQVPRVLLATSFSYAGPKNRERDLDTNAGGGYRQLNIEVPPISLTPPICIARDGEPGSEQNTGMWPLPLWFIANCTRYATMKTVVGTARSCVDWSKV